MKIFLTGATGYIGSAVAEALLAAGHKVHGLARSDAAMEGLEARGVTPRRGSLQDSSALEPLAEEADAVIHTASTNDQNFSRYDNATVDAVLTALRGSNRGFLYTSGCWVYGNTRGMVVDEYSPLDPPALVAWRPAVEKKVMDAAADNVRSIVLRPAMVYGHGRGLTAGFTRSALEKGAARVIGDGTNRWALVHIDDLADLYRRAIEQATSGTLLNAVHGESVPVQEIARAYSRASGAGGKVENVPLEDARKTLGPLADALVLDQRLSGERAKEMLGWRPTGRDVLSEASRPTG